MSSPGIVNIAAYKFAPMADLPGLRKRLKELGTSLDLKGTVLLAPEGINVFMAGARPSIDAFLSHLRALPGLSDLTPKESLSDTQPFARLLIKLKRQIITFHHPVPPPSTAPRMTPEELKRRLDAGEDLLLLDTRNTYEFQHGTFASAITLPLNDFTSLPNHLAALPASAKSRPIVTFCTGGIRCEKAAPYLKSQGFTNVYQLEGGILNYFEKVGEAHYQGACFVFDSRVSLKPDLTPTYTPR